MKVLILLAVSVFSANVSAAAQTHTYSCSCVGDAECEGMENLNIEVTGDRVTIELGSEDWEMNDSWEARLDKTYRPRTNKDYVRYIPTFGGGGYDMEPVFLIKKSMRTGSAKGAVKLQTSDEDGFSSYFYRCVNDE